MLTRLILIAVLSVSMVPMLQNQASAGCIDLGGGGQFCADWIPGSEICFGRVTGLGSDCLKNGGCQVLCAAGGTVLSNGSESGACNDDTNTFPLASETCFITGTGTCTNPGGNFNDPDQTGQPFIVEGPISGVVNVFGCTKNGRCNFFNELQPSSGGVCQNPNWTLDFTADEFKGLACACVGGTYEVTSQTATTGLPQCVGGSETCQLQVCTKSGSTYSCTAPVPIQHPTPTL